MSTELPRRILGLDPGLQTTGYGVIEISPAGPRVVEAGVVRSAEKRDTTDLSERLKALYDGIREVIEQWKPAVVAVEQLYAHVEHPRTAVLMAHARGVLFLAAAKSGIPVLSYASTKVKKLITGHGRATKEQMQHTMMRELNLAKLPEPHDVADALAVALCHFYSSGHFVLGTRSATFTGVNMKELLGEHSEDDLP
jgi:crossover junction endodeoxyribonuclease RuvC